MAGALDVMVHAGLQQTEKKHRSGKIKGSGVAKGAGQGLEREAGLEKEAGQGQKRATKGEGECARMQVHKSMQLNALYACKACLQVL